jgi:hypothetical protein
MEIDFQRVAELIFSHRENEITIPLLPIVNYNHPEVLFFGQWAGEDNHTEDSILGPSLQDLFGPDFQTALYDSLKQGLASFIDLRDENPSVHQIMAQDALYGVMLQHDAALERPERAFNVGKLEFILAENHAVATMTDFIGTGLIHNLAPMMKQRFLHGSPLYAKMLCVLEQELLFFLPCPNIFLSLVGQEVEKYDSFCNFDTHWGGLLGWYRLECIMRKSIPDFAFQFSQEQREELEEVVEDKLLKIEWLYEVVEQILSRSGQEQFQALIDFYRSIYHPMK